MSRGGLVVVLSLLLGLASLSHAGFTNVDTYLPAQTYLVERFAVYLKSEPPFGGWDDPYMRVNLSMVAKTAQNLTQVGAEALLIHADYISKIGYEDKASGSYFWCCSKQLQEGGACSTVDRLILPAETFAPAINENKVKRWDVFFNPRADSGFDARAELGFNFTAGGMYALYIVNCAASTESGLNQDISNWPVVTVTGVTEWRNPYGYLSGSIYGYLALYWFMALCYFVFGAAWAVYSLYYRKDLMGLQIAVLVVAAVSFVEMLCWALDYLVYNGNGQIMLSANIIGTLLSSTKAMLSRLLLLLVAVGYSISTETLEKATKIKLAVMMVFYFLAEAAYRYIAVVEAEGKTVPVGVQAVIILFFIAATASVWAWTFLALFRTFGALKGAKQWVKAVLYRRLLIVLGVSVIIAVAMFLFQLGVSVFDTRSSMWRVWVLWDVFWEIIFFAILVAIGVLWRPHENNRRYAYSIQINESVDDSVAVELDSRSNRVPDFLDASEAASPVEQSESDLPVAATPRTTLDERASEAAAPRKKKRAGGKRTGAKRSAAGKGKSKVQERE